MLSLTGACMVNGHEIVGIYDSKDMNVVEVTTEARKNIPDVPQHWYVVEDAHIDGVIIWQDVQGAIYQTFPGAAPVKIANSLAEYISA